MKLLSRRWQWGLLALAAVLCAVAGVARATTGSAATKITITEEDYFNTPGRTLRWPPTARRSKPRIQGVTVKRQYVPFANLDTKLLTQAVGHDLPNLLAVDNPFVSTMISTGQVTPISGLKGFSTKGYYPAVLDEGLSGGKYYSLPVAGANSIALIYNILIGIQGGEPQPAEGRGRSLVSDAKALTKLRPLRDRAHVRGRRGHDVAVGSRSSGSKCGKATFANRRRDAAGLSRRSTCGSN